MTKVTLAIDNYLSALYKGILDRDCNSFYSLDDVRVDLEFIN